MASWVFITAFNFPVAAWSWNAFLSAICGNATIWKPSPKGALCCLAVQNICNEALKAGGFPSIFLSFMEPGHELAEKMVDDERVDLLSFTGSLGRSAARSVRAWPHAWAEACLELGGNNAIILDPTADLDMAVPAIVFGAVGTAGQRCTTTRRLIAHESIIDQVTESLVHAYGQVRIGDPLDESTLMGPLTDEASVQRFEQAVAAAKAEGGEVLTGGRRVDRPGYFVEPTVIRAGGDWDIVKTGDICPDPLSDFLLDPGRGDRNPEWRTSGSVFFAVHHRHAKRRSVPVPPPAPTAALPISIIGTSGAEIGGAFGGEKETGGGRESGSDSWKAYMRRQTNNDQLGQ